MDQPLTFWAKAMARLGFVLLAIGLLPLLAIGTLFTGVSPVIPVMLSLSVAPLGVLAVLASAILFLAALVRRRRQGPS
jgi:polyferredoxin